MTSAKIRLYDLGLIRSSVSYFSWIVDLRDISTFLQFSSAIQGQDILETIFLSYPCHGTNKWELDRSGTSHLRWAEISRGITQFFYNATSGTTTASKSEHVAILRILQSSSRFRSGENLPH